MNWLHIRMHLIISSLKTIFVLESIAFFSPIHLAHINTLDMESKYFSVWWRKSWKSLYLQVFLAAFHVWRLV